MVIIVIGGVIIAAVGAVGGLLSWRGDGYGSAVARADYDSRSPHPLDALSERR